MNQSPTNNPAEGPAKWWAMLGISLAIFMATLDASIVNIALPTLVRDLKTSFSVVQWVIISYLLVLTSLMLTVARMGDIWGKKRIYSWGLVLFTLGSLLCGLAPSAGWLIAARALQGIGAAMTQSLGAAILTEIFPGHERGKAMGVIGGVVAMGLTLGPPLGGVIIGAVGWRPIFLINVPLGLVAGLMVLRFVPKLASGRTGERFDVTGGLVLLVSLSVYALAMTFGQQTGFGRPLVIAMLGGALTGLIVFLIIQAKKDQPMLDLTIFRNPLFSLNLLMGLTVFIALSGNFVMPFFLELVQGYNIRQVGLMMMVVPVCMGLLSPISGSLSDRWGSRWISVIGLIMICVGCLAVGTAPGDVTWWSFVLRLMPFGLGMGLFQAPNNSAIMGQVPPHRLGVAGGLLSFSRTMGHSTGVPLMGALFAALAASHPAARGVVDAAAAPPESLTAALQGTYLAAGAIVFIALIMGLAAAVIDRRRS